MRYYISLLVLAVFMMGCQPKNSPVMSTEESANGNVALTFDKVNAPAEVRVLTAVLTRSGFPSIEKSLNIITDTSASIMFESVAVGTWKVTVNAKDGPGTILYSGQSEVIVLENIVTRLDLMLVPVLTGVGSVQINVTWGSGTSPQFPKTFGGLQRDMSMCVIQTKDGGFVIGGVSYSYGSGGDAWLVKTDANGIMQWKKNYGGSGEDRINNIMQTDDGGFIFVGYKLGDDEDSWIGKLDSIGTLQWEKTYGTPRKDAYLILNRLSDGSYLTCGYIADSSIYDGQVVKFSPSGELLWKKTFGGIGGDFTMNFVEQRDRSIIVSGYFGSNFSKHYDFWIFKLDENGNTKWEKVYGESFEERSSGIVQLPNGTLMVGGYRSANGKQDGLIMNIDSTGTILWTKEYDFGGTDMIIRLQRSPDNTVVASGYSSIGNLGNQGVLMKIDNAGNPLWIKNYGGNGAEVFIEHRVLNDGKIVVAGTTTSTGNGNEDFWLVKVDRNGIMQ